MARPQHDLALLGHQRRLSFEDVDELVLTAVAMQQCQFPTRQEPRQVDAEILSPNRSPSGRFSRLAMREKKGSG